MRFWPGTRLTRLGAKRRKATWSLRGSGQNPKCERCWGMLRHNEQPVSTCDVGAQLLSAIAADRAKRQLGGLHFVAPWQHGRGTESREKNIIRTWHIAVKQILSQEPANAPCEFYGDSSVPYPILHRRPGPQSSPPIWGSAWHCDRRWALASHWGTNLAETPFFCIQLNSWSKDRPGSRQKCQLVLCPKALPSRVHFFHRAFLSTWEATQADDMGPGEGCVTGLRQAQTKQDSPEPHHFCWGGLVLISHQGGLSLTTACRWPLAGLHFIKSPTVPLVDNLGR